MYVYPSIFEETFCISLLECMAAGLYCITTNYGALFETGQSFLCMFRMNQIINLAQKFAIGIDAAAESLHREEIHNHLECQSAYAQVYYGWNKIGTSWKRFLEGAVNAKK